MITFKKEERIRTNNGLIYIKGELANGHYWYQDENFLSRK